jgi:hypothetical protein
MMEYSAENSTIDKSAPSFIERELLKIGNEFIQELWENYGIGIDIKHYCEDGIRVVKDEDLGMLDEARKYLLSRMAKVQRLRARFTNILSFAAEYEKERVAKALGVKVNELCGIGADYENLIASTIG